MKQGQIGLILVIAAVLFLIVILLLHSQNFPTLETSSDPTNIALFVEHSSTAAMAHCLKQFGLHGGRFDTESKFKTSFGNVGHAYRTGPNVLTLTELRRELEQCVMDVLLLCINDFHEARAIGLSVAIETPTVVAQLAARDTSVDIEFPVSVTTGQTRQTFDRFAATQPVRLKTLHQLTKQIADDRSSYIRPSDIDLSYLGSLSVNTNIYQYGNNQIYEMRDHASRLHDGPFVFLSAHSFEE